MEIESIKSLSILDKDYLQWIKELSSRYRRSQVKASVKVNQVMLQFYWELGKDIVEKKAESRWGSGFMKNLSRDLKEVNPDAKCFSETNLLYMKNFYLLYYPCIENAPQIVEQKEKAITPQLVEQIQNDLFSVPWSHHRFIIDKYKESPEKALFFVHQTVENGWSRDMLLNFMGTDLYERLRGGADTNKDRWISARELYDFVHQGVVEASANKQQPVMWGKFNNDMTIIKW